MAVFSGSKNFATSGGAAGYRLVVNVTTAAVSGGTQLEIAAYAERIRFDLTAAFSSSGTRSYSVPGGRTNSTSGSLLESGSAAWSYDFRSSSVQYIWGSASSGILRYIPFSYGSSTTVSITAAGSGSSFLLSTTVNVPVTLEQQSLITVPNVIGQNYVTAYSTIANAGLSPNISGTATTTNASQADIVYSQSPSGGSSVTAGSTVNYQYYVYTPPTYTVTFNPNNGGSTSSVSVTSGNTTTTPAAPSRSGFTFSGWLSDYNGLTYGASSTTHQIFANTTFTAQWTVIQYTLFFEENGGAAVSDITANSGSNVTLPTTTRTGYTFAGWFSNAALTIGPFTSWTLTNNQTLYAKWTLLAPGWTDQSIESSLLLNQNLATRPNRSVSATNAVNYEIIYGGTALNPTSWITINSSGQLSGSTNIIGTYSFIINAINAEGVKTPSSVQNITVSYPGKRINAALGTNNITNAKRYDGANWVSITSMKRYDGTSWLDITN